jgi:hypothetical protein
MILEAYDVLATRILQALALFPSVGDIIQAVKKRAGAPTILVEYALLLRCLAGLH